MNSFGERLRVAVAQEGSRLRSIGEDIAGARPQVAHSWSKKEELGHLIDSATNNRVRFVKAAVEGKYEGPSYDGRAWVDLGGYADMPWSTLIDLWASLNSALANAVDRIPQERLSCSCRIAVAKPVTLEFLIDDYILHMKHHLDHILDRDRLTEYPGAAIGV
jgi:hypothetical protein